MSAGIGAGPAPSTARRPQVSRPPSTALPSVTERVRRPVDSALLDPVIHAALGGGQPSRAHAIVESVHQSPTEGACPAQRGHEAVERHDERLLLEVLDPSSACDADDRKHPGGIAPTPAREPARRVDRPRDVRAPVAQRLGLDHEAHPRRGAQHVVESPRPGQSTACRTCQPSRVNGLSARRTWASDSAPTRLRRARRSARRLIRTKTPESRASRSPSTAWPAAAASIAATSATVAPAARDAAVIRRRRCWRRA